MNMMGPVARLTAMDSIVALAVLFAGIFLAAWLASPRLRAWVERPKYRFQSDTRCYDRAQNSKITLEGRNIRS